LFGLVLAEVSFDSDDEMNAFSPPPFAIGEVTNNDLFSGGRLSQLTFTEIRPEIMRLTKTTTV